MFMDEMRMYMETAYGGQAQYCNWPCVNADKDKGATFIGKETVNGMETDKYKMACIDKNGNTTGDFLWFAANGQLAVKMDFTMTGKAGKRKHFVVELRNIKFAKQNPSLFEAPKGYSKMSGMPMGGGMPGGMPKAVTPEECPWVARA